MEVSIVKLKGIIDSIIEWVKTDLSDKSGTPTKSWLYEEFNGVEISGVNFYTNLYNILLRGDEEKRKLETRLMFDRERANLPTIHVHYPSEDVRAGDNTINTGFSNYTIDTGNTLNGVYSRSFVGQYEIIITGGNSLEVVMLYEFLDGLMIAAADTFAYNFDKFEFSGKQLMANQEIIPYLTFYRAIGLSLQAKKSVKSIVSKSSVSDIKFKGGFEIDGSTGTPSGGVTPIGMVIIRACNFSTPVIVSGELEVADGKNIYLAWKGLREEKEYIEGVHTFNFIFTNPTDIFVFGYEESDLVSCEYSAQELSVSFDSSYMTFDSEFLDFSIE